MTVAKDHIGTGVAMVVAGIRIIIIRAAGAGRAHFILVIEDPGV